MSSLFDLCGYVAGRPDALLVRVVDGTGPGRGQVGAVRAYLPGGPPLGVLVDPRLHDVLDRLAERQVSRPDRAHLLLLRHPDGGSLTVLVQRAGELPPVVWDLVQARCPLVLRTQLDDGQLRTTVAVRLPDGFHPNRVQPPVVGGPGVIVERLTPAPRLTLLGNGVLVEALSEIGRELGWGPTTLSRFSPGDLQDLSALDVLLVVVDDAETRWRAAVAGVMSRAGYVGVVCPRSALAGAPRSDGRWHVLGAGEPGTTSPKEAALLLLDAVVAGRRPQPVDDDRLLVLTGAD